MSCLQAKVGFMELSSPAVIVPLNVSENNNSGLIKLIESGYSSANLGGELISKTNLVIEI